MKLFKTVRGRAFFAAITATLVLTLITFLVVIAAGGTLAVALHNSYVVLTTCSISIVLAGIVVPMVAKIADWIFDD